MILCIFLQPGCVNTTEVDIKKACRMSKPGTAATVKPTVNKVSKRSRISRDPNFKWFFDGSVNSHAKYR